MSYHFVPVGSVSLMENCAKALLHIADSMKIKHIFLHRRICCRDLDVEKEMHYVSVLHDVILALYAHFSGGTTGRLGLE